MSWDFTPAPTVAKPIPTRVVNGFHVVVLPHGAPAVTSEDVKRLQGEFE